MSEEILFDRSMIEARSGQKGQSRSFVGNGKDEFGNVIHGRLGNHRAGNDRGRDGLNPRARSFFVCGPSQRSIMS